MEKVQLTVTLELGVGTREAIAQLVTAIENNTGKVAKPGKGKTAAADDAEETSAISIADIKAARGKKGKKGAKADPEPEADEPEEVDADDEPEADEPDADEPDAEEEEEEEEEFEEEEEAEDDDKISAAQLEGLKKALGAHKKKHGMDKTVAVLKKHGKAPKSDLVKPENLAALLKALKV